jgi:Ca2+-binding EF-hand superfamily protein
VRLPQIFNVSPLPTETDLRKVFKRLDTRNEGVIDAANLKRLLLPADETSRALGSDKDITLRGTIAPQRTQDAHLRCGTVISPIDSCGVPFTEHAVDDYLEKYCKVHKDKVTFPEFCSMMMDIARR